MNDDSNALAYQAWLAQQQGLTDSPIYHDRIAALETGVAMANRRIDELVDRLAGTNTQIFDELAKQRAVNEALLAWATEMDQTTVHSALLDALEP